MKTLILAIETSCDETSAAVIENGHVVRSNLISSQIDIHQVFGGVVPEIASRHHLERVSVVVKQALEEANASFSDLDAIAVTNGPGLVGALLVGVSYAKGLAYSLGLPLVSVNHIESHIYANFLGEAPPSFPLLCLVVSGGHTELVLMQGHGRYKLLGKTRDDAAGEAFDKIARVLGLPYPGGPHLERLALQGEDAFAYPRAKLEPGSYDFSFSGLKSAVINHLHNSRQKGETLEDANVAKSFQSAVVEVLVDKTMSAALDTGVREICLAGGVSANGALRQRLEQEADERGIRLHLPPLVYCTDNAAMVGSLGYYRYRAGCSAGLDLNAQAVMPISNWPVDKSQ